MYRFKLLFNILLIIPCYLYSQEPAVKPLTKYFTANDIQFGLSNRNIDTTSNRLEIYNPAYKKIVFNDLGNIGLPAQSLLVDLERPVGFQYGFNPFGIYILDPLNCKYINTRLPFTDITYAQGGAELLLLQLKHAQNINPRWNIGLEMNRITSEGFLLEQNSSLYGFDAFTSYYNKRKRYALLANLTFNFGQNDESGGIQSDSAFEELSGKRKQVYTNLANSTTKFHNRSVFVKQFLRFGESRFITTDKDTTYDFTPSSQFIYTIHANEWSYAFLNNGDTNSYLLPNQYYDIGTVTYDSVYYGKLTNQLQFQIFGSKSQHNLGSLGDSAQAHQIIGIRHELINVAQPALVRQYHNYIIDGSFDLISFKTQKTNLHIGASYVLDGYNANDFKIDTKLVFDFKPVSVHIYTMYEINRPDYFHQLYKSNAFIWNNSFDKTTTLISSIAIHTNRFRNNFKLVFKDQQVSNFVFMNSQALPQQDKNDINIYTLSLSKTFQYWKFYFDHELYYQKSNSNNIRIPEFSGMIRYYFQSRLFGIARFQVGFTALYNTAYRGYAYQPATRNFFLQDDVVIGNYPVISPFFVGDIKRASLFVVFDHMNMDWIKKGMYYTAHYPIALNSLRMGVRWRMYD